MTLERWNPFSDALSLRQAMDRLFEDALVRPTRFWGADGLDVPIDLSESESDFTLKMALPGIKPEEVDVSAVGNMLTIRGEHKSEEEASQKGQTWRHREIRYGRFERSITLPTDVQADRAEARFENGMLTLRLPKAESAKPRRIQITGPKMAIEGKNRS